MTRLGHTAPTWRTVKIGTINAEYDGSVLDDLLIDPYDPHVVSVQQANGVDLNLRGYRTIRAGRSYEGRGVALLVRKDVKVLEVKRFKMTEPWTGPKAGKRHKPREYVAALCEYRGTEFWVVGIHGPFGTKPQAEVDRFIAGFAKRHPGRPVFFAGDFNESAHHMEQLAEDFDGDYEPVGKVDGVVSRDAKKVVAHRRLAPEGRKWHGIGCVSYRIEKENRT